MVVDEYKWLNPSSTPIYHAYLSAIVGSHVRILTPFAESPTEPARYGDLSHLGKNLLQLASVSEGVGLEVRLSL